MTPADLVADQASLCWADVPNPGSTGPATRQIACDRPGVPPLFLCPRHDAEKRRTR
ncbi:MAG: hypothetical protein M3O70_08825 [Actinomycetota bacterium]|nr:hypothetical protein [Actinomycetota bacterium]